MERAATDTKATASTAGVDGDGETQVDANEEEIQTGADDGASVIRVVKEKVS